MSACTFPLVLTCTWSTGALKLNYYDELERNKGRHGVIYNLSLVLRSKDSPEACVLDAVKAVGHMAARANEVCPRRG